MTNFPCGHPRTSENSLPNGTHYKCRECARLYQLQYARTNRAKYTRTARAAKKRKYSAALADVW